ncbi:MAG: hypothetical protein IPL53_20055 [Ignavibacteria bacterium]|nr:hypothetical protein [Ignavibacteria bacterium]
MIYADNGLSKPGSLIYKSPNLLTPAGTGSVVTLPPYTIDTLLTVQPGKRFFVGYRQTSVNSLKAAFQNEVPIRDSSFFFTTSDTGNVWYDFSDSSKNSKIDIAAVVSNSELKINYIIEGFYNDGTGLLNMKDTVRVYLRNSVSPYPIIDSVKGIIDSVNFKGSFLLKRAVMDPYFIEIKHRNTIVTWSKNPVYFTIGDKTSYNFTTSETQAYGNNMILVNTSPARYAGYSGDVNQNGFIDLTDLIAISNNASNFVTGYVNTDVDGDNITDLTDVIICYNNSTMFVSKITP